MTLTTPSPAVPVIPGPFGPADWVADLSTAKVSALYRVQHGIDIGRHFDEVETLDLYRCRQTGMEFWRPERVAAKEGFYVELSAAIDGYYNAWRWEFGIVDGYLSPDKALLEVGCGVGAFLKRTEGRVARACGADFNADAIRNKITSWPIERRAVRDIADRDGPVFDIVCCFQVLEHVIDPNGFIRDCLAATKPGGLVALSAPNYGQPRAARRETALDLPPHHMNHFTEDSLRRIAQVLGVEVEAVRSPLKRLALEPVSKRTEQSLAYRLARKIAYTLIHAAYARTGEAGHTVMALLRKPG